MTSSKQKGEAPVASPIRPVSTRTVVVAWGAGAYTFRYRWQAAMFRYFARRWSGWTSWTVLSEVERARSIRPHPAKEYR